MSVASSRYNDYALHENADDINIPPPYDYDKSAVHPDDLADAKKSVDEDRVPVPAQNGSVVLDMLKTKDFKFGTRIVPQSGIPGGAQAGEVLYTIATHGQWNWKGAVVTFQRGDGKGPTTSSASRYQYDSLAEGKNGEAPPYAELSCTKLRLAEHPEHGQALDEQSRRKFLHSQKWWSARNRFDIDGVEYRLKAKFSGNYDLYLPSGPGGSDGLLLAVFRHKAFSRTTRGTIEILPAAIATGAEGVLLPNEALLYNGRPTWLLDVVIMAEHLYKADTEAAAAASSSASSASAAAAVA